MDEEELFPFRPLIGITMGYAPYVISSELREYGASVMDSRTDLTRIEDEIGSFYILPSSMHEVIIFPKSLLDESAGVAGALEMVHEVNRTQVSRCDFLSNNIYLFDKGILSMIREEDVSETASRLA